jgi:hypothetical protein
VSTARGEVGVSGDVLPISASNSGANTAILSECERRQSEREERERETSGSFRTPHSTSTCAPVDDLRSRLTTPRTIQHQPHRSSVLSLFASFPSTSSSISPNMAATDANAALLDRTNA